MMRRQTAMIVVIGAVTLICASHVPGSGQELKKITIGISTPQSVSAFPVLAAKDLGHFKAEGLDANTVVINSDLAVKALLSGDLDYASSTSSVAKAAAVGFPVKVVMSFFNGTDFRIVTKPEIQTPKELKDKTIAISRFGSSVDFDLRALLRHLGLDATHDVKIIQVGSGNLRLVSLISGRVDAAVLNTVEAVSAHERGMKTLIATGKFNRQTLTGIGASIPKLQKGRDEVRRVLRACLHALTDFKANPAKIRPLLIKHTRIKPEQFEAIYESSLEVFSADGTLTDEDVRLSYESARKDATNSPAVQISNIIDLSVLREIAK
jgi:ABC-type nitrate/sulfonate/bicarbonate transport system substrate-binding protein